MRRGVATVRAKAAPSGGRGKFTAYVSIFGNLDLGGDRVVRGAFAKSLAKWRASGDRVPVVFSHNSHDPHQIVGSADPDAMREDDRGLLVVGEFDLETETGRQVWKLVRDRLIKEWSFSYLVERERTADDGANELLVVDLIEVGPTIRGMNPDTATLSTKSLAACTACHVDGPRRREKSAEADLAEAIDAAARDLGLPVPPPPRPEPKIIDIADRDFDVTAGANGPRRCAYRECDRVKFSRTRWWCEDHRAYADPEPAFRVDPQMRLVATDPRKHALEARLRDIEEEARSIRKELGR